MIPQTYWPIILIPRAWRDLPVLLGPILLKPPAAPKCQAVPAEAGHLAAADTSGRGTAGATECEHAGTPLLAHTNLAGLGKHPTSPAHSVTFRTMDTPLPWQDLGWGRNVNV